MKRQLADRNATADSLRARGWVSPYVIAPIILTGGENNGERMPFLLMRDTRMPAVAAMEWLVSSRRGRAVAARTLERELSYVALFHEWLTRENLNLDDPFEFVKRFTPNRIESSLRGWVQRDRSRGSIVRISVGKNEIRMRLDTIRHYVDWHLGNAQSHLSVRTQSSQIIAFSKAREAIGAAFDDIRPRKAPSADREGLSGEEVALLIKLVDPTNDQCPWAIRVPWSCNSNGAKLALRYRNQLIVHLMLSFGLRRGDLLKLRVGDVMTHSSDPYLNVCRRPDDPSDSRRSEPNAKTLERMLPLNLDLARLLDDYVTKWRRHLPNAKRTPYLFISSHDGRPMSARALNEVFEAMQVRMPGIHPHVLRHTHNDRLRQVCNGAGLDDRQAESHAKYINGWLGDNRGTYTKREARLSAHKMSAAVQASIFS